jgi:hypothetical protein
MVSPTLYLGEGVPRGTLRRAGFGKEKCVPKFKLVVTCGLSQLERVPAAPGTPLWRQHAQPVDLACLPHLTQPSPPPLITLSHLEDVGSYQTDTLASIVVKGLEPGA